MEIQYRNATKPHRTASDLSPCEATAALGPANMELALATPHGFRLRRQPSLRRAPLEPACPASLWPMQSIPCRIFSGTAAAHAGRALVLSLCVAASFGAIAHELVGTVVGVMDGDTVDVIDEDKHVSRIRLASIDAPEKGQAFGQNAKRALSDLVFSQSVSVDWRKTDRYRRLVGVIRVRGVDVGLKMIEDGWAWHYKQYQSEQTLVDRARYSHAEQKARAGAIGLWSQPEPLPPWEFRASRRRCGNDRDVPYAPRHRKSGCERSKP